MVLYIPFIHKIKKKEKQRPEQIPLYIEQYNPKTIDDKKEESEPKSVIIIELS